MGEIGSNARRILVGVGPAGTLRERPRLFAALERAFPVKFVNLGEAVSPEAIVWSGGPPPEQTPARRETAAPTLALTGEEARPGEVEDVLLQRSTVLDPRLREVTLLGQRVSKPLVPGAYEEVVALATTSARWCIERGPIARYRVAGALPELEGRDVLRVGLSGEHALSVIALVHFVRAVSRRVDFVGPPLRAAIVFDDPNIRWSSYGYIDYRRLVEHADTHGYHAVVAMIPRDSGYAHPATAALFRRRADRLSLAYHGNDHMKNELLAVSDTNSATRMCAQAIRRVRRFESRSGATVDRVMTPPHGMCAESVAWALANVGFEALAALCPTPWSELPPADALLAGWGPANFAGPIAVVPRFELAASTTAIGLRAFMDNPIVIYGHHGDLANGLDVLAEAAARVNGRGGVQWMSLGRIARSNFAVRFDGDTLVVRPYAATLTLRPPDGALQLVVERPEGAGVGLAGWSLGDQPPVAFDEPALLGGRNTAVTIRLRPRDEVDPMGVPAPAASLLPPARRTAAEIRDRVMPLASSWRGRLAPRH